MIRVRNRPAILPAREGLREELQFFVRSARAPRIRTIRQFAEEELILPEGPYAGECFRVKRQPFSGLLLDEIDSGRWQKYRVTGCVQAGKTLLLFILPTLYHLFEHCEPVICGVPAMNMAGDKWRKELLPAINQNPRFRAQLRETGKGSRGGSFELLELANGAMLRFMSGHGGDEMRSGFTARILVVTEADRVDTAGDSSREAAPIYQMEARTAAYGDDARLYAECTTTTESGFIWQEYSENSTASKIMCPCPHCGVWVCPEREHFVGWEECESIVEASERATFICPSCQACLNNDERRSMNLDAVLAHLGQTINKRGEIEGEPPATKTLGFRWNAFNNLLWDTAFIGAEEWEAARARDFHSAELKRRQWAWTIPAAPDIFDETPLTTDQVAGRVENLGRGILPADTVYLSAGVDLRARQLHFVVVAWLSDGRGHIVDFGTLPVNSRELGVRKALRAALEQLHETRLAPGYAPAGGERRAVGWTVIDSNWEGEVVRTFCRNQKRAGNHRYLPSIGKGQSVPASRGGYQQPTRITAQKPHIGDQYYIHWQSKHLVYVAIVNADAWKTRVHDGFAMPADQPGALTLFDPSTTADKRELQVFCSHVVSEKLKIRLVAGKGPVPCWENESRRANHYLDGLSLASVGGHLCGVRVAEDSPRGGVPLAAASSPAEASSPNSIMEDGTPYLITDREDAL